MPTDNVIFVAPTETQPVYLTDAFDGHENLRAKMRYLRTEINWRAYKALFAAGWVDAGFERGADYVSMLHDWRRKGRRPTGEMNRIVSLSYRLEKSKPDAADEFFYCAGRELIDIDEKIKY